MTQKHSVLHINFKVTEIVDLRGVKNKILTLPDDATADKLYNFTEYLQVGQYVDVFYDANKDDGTLAQLAKVHACIRQLAIDTGDGFEDIKLEVKRTSGLCVTKEINGVKYMICKSFSKCSKEELNLVIDRIIKIGELVGINFH